jgi:hypothetical protein
VNTNEAAQILLTYFSPEERAIPDNVTYPGRNAAVRKAMNDALQDLFSKGKPWCRSEERGSLINAPVNLNVKVTQGSSVAEIPESDWRTWFRGCALAIEGVDHDNQVKSDGEIIGDFPEGSVLVEGIISPSIGVLIPAGETNGKPALSSDGEQTPSGSGWAKAVFDGLRGEGNEWTIAQWDGEHWMGWAAPGYNGYDLLDIPASAWLPFIDTDKDALVISSVQASINDTAIAGHNNVLPRRDGIHLWASNGWMAGPEDSWIQLSSEDSTLPTRWLLQSGYNFSLGEGGFRSSEATMFPDEVLQWEPFGNESAVEGTILNIGYDFGRPTGPPLVSAIHPKRQFILKLPYAGASGTHPARLFHDCITLGVDVLEVHEPVKVDGCEIRPLNNSHTQGRPRRDDYGFRESGPACCPPGRVSSAAAKPRAFHVETYLAGPSAVPTYRLRLMPAPSTASLIEYNVMLVPPKVTDLAATTILPIPFDYVESVFLPFAVKKLRSGPFWRGVVGEDQVQSDYINALGILNESEPQRRSGIKFHFPY